ncbi:MAG: hypothetical protein M0Z46_19330 [Actinomycetota bacterium]|nr:hypothetical protein [Actinomycetota bacterium]
MTDTPLAVVRVPTGPAFTVVLVCHVAAVLMALVVSVAGAVAAARVLFTKEELAPSVRSYFSPGVNWAGRVLYLVPVLGAALLAMSGGAYRLDATWVDWGLGLWAAAIALAEGVLWPAERRVQRILAAADAGGVPESARSGCKVMCASSVGVVALVVAAMVVMVAKP